MEATVTQTAREKALAALAEQEKQEAAELEAHHQSESESLSAAIRKTLGNDTPFEIVTDGRWPRAKLSGIDQFTLVETHQGLSTRWPNGESEHPDTYASHYAYINNWADVGRAIKWYEEHTPVVSKRQPVRFDELMLSQANEETRPFKIIGLNISDGAALLVVEYTEITPAAGS